MFPSLSLPAIFAFSFLVGMGAVVSPGPVSTTIVSQSPRSGWLVGPLVAIGHSALELLIVVLITLGLGAGLAHSSIQTAIALSGGVLLAWMGGSLVWSTWRGKIHLPGSQAKLGAMSYGQLVTLGAVATVSNPFWYAWWVTVAAGYLAQAQALGVAAIAAFYLGHVTADFAWDTVLSAVVGGGRRWMTDTIYRLIVLASGAFLIYLGYTFLVNGITRLR
jgi:threonine/homoserine/homoserine lactone efflux protein